MLTLSRISVTLSVTPRRVYAIPEKTLSILSAIEMTTAAILLTSEGETFFLHNLIAFILVESGDNP